MMHLKNITAGNPKTKEQYQLTKQFNIKRLYSDDGKNWYEEQKNFQPDTLKMVYDHNGVIICIEKDVSAINPEGASVVELPDITANRRADISGKWLFKDGVVIKRTYTEEEQRQQAENEKQSLLQLVRDKTQLRTAGHPAHILTRFACLLLRRGIKNLCPDSPAPVSVR